MPSAWKKPKLGEIPRLLASAIGSRARRGVGDSALVVQAGFPTSVADLVVKNRGRLKGKAPRWLRRKGHPVEGEAEPGPGCFIVAPLASEIVEAVVSVDEAPPPGSVLRSAERKQEETQRWPVTTAVETTRGAIAGECLGRSRWEEEEESRESEGSASEASTRPKPEKDALQTRNSWRFLMPSKVVFLVFVLAIGTQKIALGASISAFAILLLESMGRRLISSQKACEGSKKKCSRPIAGVVSVPGSNERIPIKNLAAFCDRSFEIHAPVEVVSAPVPTLEPKEHVEAEGSRRNQKASNNSKRAKRLLKKIVPKKLRRPKGEKVEKAGPASDCSSKGASHRGSLGEHPLKEEEDVGPGDDGSKDEEEDRDGVLGFEVAAGVQDVGLKGAAFLGEKNVGGQSKWSSGRLVFFLIILSGLVAGRAAAMVLTIVWCLLLWSARTLWKCWKMQHSH